MRRIILLASVLSATIAVAPSAQAAGTTYNVYHFGGNLHLLGGVTGRLLPATRVRVPARATITNSVQLKFPLSMFPSDFSLGASQPVDANTADQTFPFGQLHDTYLHSPYRNEGMLGGWFEGAVKKLANGGFFETYLASYYENSDQAKTVLTTVATSMSQIGSPTTCNFGQQCVQVEFSYNTASGDPYTGVYRVAVQDNAVLETEFDVDNADYAGQKAAGNAFLENVSRTFAGTVAAPPSNPTPLPTVPEVTITPAPPVTALPTPVTTTPTPVTHSVNFNILAVRVEKDKSKPDFQLANSPLSKVKSGTRVYLAIYFKVNDAPPNAAVGAEWTVKAQGRTLLDKSASNNLPADAAGTYRLTLVVKLSGKGTFIVAGKVSIGSQVEQGSTAVQVAKKKKH